MYLFSSRKEDNLRDLLKKFTDNWRTLALGAAVAVFVWTGVGFGWFGSTLSFGWFTPGGARVMAEEAVTERLTPMCVANAMQDDPAKLVEFNEVSSYRQDEFVSKAGWATFEGDTPDEGIADSCAAALVDVLAEMEAQKG